MNRKTFSRRALIGTVAVIASLGLAACGGADSGHDGHSSGESSKSKDFNDADVMFAQMMIPHHEQAVEMSELAGTRAAYPYPAISFGLLGAIVQICSFTYLTALIFSGNA
ncbi:MAG: DUF305 domain-containing protein, partial [Stackebrandtia sp.]